jgi:hypothetical protein
VTYGPILKKLIIETLDLIAGDEKITLYKQAGKGARAARWFAVMTTTLSLFHTRIQDVDTTIDFWHPLLLSKPNECAD